MPILFPILPRFPIRSEVDSVPVDTLSTLIQSKFVEVINAQNALLAGSSGSEVAEARNGGATLNERLVGPFGALGSGILSYKIVLDDGDATSNWSASANGAVSLNNSNFVQGTGAINLRKTGTQVTVDYIVDPVNFTLQNKFLVLSIFLKDAATVAKLPPGSVFIDATPDATFVTNYKRWAANLTAGWNTLVLEGNNPLSIAGTVTDSQILQKIRISVTTNASSDLLAAGDFEADYVYTFGDEARVRAQTVPNTTVQILPYWATIIGFFGSKTTTQNSAAIPAPTTNPRIDVLLIDYQNVTRYVLGAELASPLEPPTPWGSTKIAAIFNRVGQTSIKDVDDSVNGYIIDRRVFIDLPEKDLALILGDMGFKSLGATDVAYSYTGDLLTAAIYHDSNGNAVASAIIAYTGEVINTITVTIGARQFQKTYAYTGDFVDSETTVEL